MPPTRNVDSRNLRPLDGSLHRISHSYAQSSPSISAALNHYIGYEHAADIAAEAVHTGRTVREVAGERTDLPAEQLDEILDPIRLARGLGQTCRERQE